MHYLTGAHEENLIKAFLMQAAKAARLSMCKKSQRGAIIVDEAGVIIGRGYNMPTICGMCCMRGAIHDNGQVERCAAIHAEQMAILNALSYRESLKGFTLYHIKLKDGLMIPSGHPSCTICSRIVFFSGVRVVLWHREGYARYEPGEFNDLSFKYFLEKSKRGP